MEENVSFICDACRGETVARPRDCDIKDNYKLNRKNLRLKEYDYGLKGAYFITICTNKHKNLFWKNLVPLDMNTQMKEKLNVYGKIVEETWLNSMNVYKDILLEEYAIMPNHFHGIILKLENSDRTIGYIVGQFKSTAEKQIRKYEHDLKVWQRNYYEHVIRGSESEKIKKYIMSNPYNLNRDKYFV